MLRLLDPNRSLTPRMWAIIGLAFAAWLFWFCFYLWRFDRLVHRSDGFPGYLCVGLPGLIFSFGSAAVEKKLQPHQERKNELAILLAVIAFAIAFAFFMVDYVKPTNEAVFWFTASFGLFGIAAWARQWSRRAHAFTAGVAM